MRTVLLAVLLAGIAAPALADPCDPDARRRANVATMERDAERARAATVDREVRAREQKLRTEATIRAMRAGELAGGYPGAPMSWRTPEIVEPGTPPPLPSPLQSPVLSPLPSPLPSLVPSAPRPTPELTGDAARMDALMAEAMARSTARVRAMTPDSPR